jgi:hypothetical protein
MTQDLRLRPVTMPAKEDVVSMGEGSACPSLLSLESDGQPLFFPLLPPDSLRPSANPGSIFRGDSRTKPDRAGPTRGPLGSGRSGKTAPATLLHVPQNAQPGHSRALASWRTPPGFYGLRHRFDEASAAHPVSPGHASSPAAGRDDRRPCAIRSRAGRLLFRIS